MLKAGYACRDITPEPGITLSGFAVRRNQSSRGVDDPLNVRALALENDQGRALLLVFDLLALGPEITEQLHAALDTGPGLGVPRERRFFCCTHTHSAPATITLHGCGIVDDAYWRRLCDDAAAAAEAAFACLRPARLRQASVELPGCNYNRRQVLADGRVTMTQFPQQEVVEVGPVWEDMVLLRLEDERGVGIVGIASWAAHPDTVATQQISADYPGELCRRLSERFYLPFLYLQGPAGNVNPPLKEMTRPEMLANVTEIMALVGEPDWSEPETVEELAASATSVFLVYGPSMPEPELRELHQGMAAPALTAVWPKAIVEVLADLLNVEPGQQPDPAAMRFTAAIMRDWSGALLARPASPGGRDMALQVLRLGPLAFCFFAAEVFVETGLALREARPELQIVPVAYAAPLVGYLPTDKALEEGGYEAAQAYVFYGHPAPFARGSERRARNAVLAALDSLAAPQ